MTTGRRLLLLLCTALPGCTSPSPAPAPTPPPRVAPSPYAGQESRQIKSLSSADIGDLRAGKGWGFARPAELNGVPGPLHVLELAHDLALSDAQRAEVNGVFERMRARARELGAAFVDAEARLSDAFTNGSPDPAALRELVVRSGRLRAELRLAHLEAHLETAPLLTAEQRARYVELRGYGGGDPCANPPAGHDAAMWRRHHGCD